MRSGLPVSATKTAPPWWLQDEWLGTGNPSTIRRGVALRSYLDGDNIDRSAIEGATGLDDPRVQKAVTRMRLDMIAAHGRRYLAPVQDEIDGLGDPKHLIAKDDLLRAAFYRRVKDGHHSPQDLALIAEVESREAQLKDARQRYAVILWRCLAHLYRHGIAVGITMWNVLSMSLRQAMIPPELLGRVRVSYICGEVRGRGLSARVSPTVASARRRLQRRSTVPASFTRGAVSRTLRPRCPSRARLVRECDPTR